MRVTLDPTLILRTPTYIYQIHIGYHTRLQMKRGPRSLKTLALDDLHLPRSIDLFSPPLPFGEIVRVGGGEHGHRKKQKVLVVLGLNTLLSRLERKGSSI